MLRLPPTTTRFPYTTLFRSVVARAFAPPGTTYAPAKLPFDQGSSEHGTHVAGIAAGDDRSEEHTSELQSLRQLVCRLLVEKKNLQNTGTTGQAPRHPAPERA